MRFSDLLPLCVSLFTNSLLLIPSGHQLVNGFLEKASEKVLDPASSDFTRLSVLDLVVALAPHADEAAISKLYSTIRPYLESKSHGIQKKAYRVLEEVCASPQGPGARFVQNHLDELKKTLLDSLRSTSSPAKRPRLKCLIHIVKKLSAEHEEFISALVPEVILCTKEVSVGARKNAFVLLVEMGHAFLRFGPSQEEALQRYLVLIYPGLVGAVTMVSCSILALTHLLFEFKGKRCFLEGLGGPWGRKMPRRSGQGGCPSGKGPLDGGRKAQLPALSSATTQLGLPASPCPASPLEWVGWRR